MTSAEAVSSTQVVDGRTGGDGQGREGGWWAGRSELGVAAFLLAVGVVVLVDASRIPGAVGANGPVGPKAVPVLVGGLLLLVAAVLALDVLRGGKGEAEAGEDVDLGHASDWRTVALLAGAFLANAALIDRVGWPVSGAVLFFGAAYALGSRSLVRDLLVSVGMSVVSYLLFAKALGVNLPAGVLDGVI